MEKVVELVRFSLGMEGYALRRKIRIGGGAMREHGRQRQ
jgi:hypothetical protein